MTTSLPFTARTTATRVLDGVDLVGRRIVVTGGASGIGAETVRALARAGAEVTVAVRDPAGAAALVAELPTGAVRVAALDLADLDSVAAFARAWSGPLDVFVANAGVMAIPERRVTALGWELQLATNYLGHFALASALHGHLRAAGRSRLVVVSSGAHRDAPFDFADPQFERRPYDRWSAYGQSKTADVLLAVGASRRWAEDGVTANAVNPGWVMTGLQRHVDDATMKAMGAMDEHGAIIEQPYSRTLAEGAAASVLLAGSPLVRDLTGQYVEGNQVAPVAVEGHPGGVAAHAVDPEAAERLWALGSRALG
ncbi:SDR family NAD(P)-dependent oxidoreductase [Umezawaea endophytica]|uniref:Probable oxidoreductase n=1 Tax=Umezawaea endophytica TaxID=1654476 RepID=A0A9X2VFD7_9PSEU|nr:SDR family NAD(P)-dependent oxidoreductase [Umezawaea endophytica]MCS7475520.1 SDR family NAD(P)-dependent oxidoreductase [Umezawaea endophytica]